MIQSINSINRNAVKRFLSTVGDVQKWLFPQEYINMIY